MFENLTSELAALAQVLLIDIVLAGDNAIVVGMAAAGVDKSIRKKVIFWGIGGAVALRIMFALLTTQLLAIVGLTLAGGVLLLWVCWKMYREIRHTAAEEQRAADIAAGEIHGEAPETAAQPKTFKQAMVQIILADVSMSLDNVLAVAGAAKDHLWVLIIGLLMSVALMGAAASLIASLLAKHRWIAWVGFAVILYVALDMIYRGLGEVACLSASDIKACTASPFNAIKATLFGGPAS